MAQLTNHMKQNSNIYSVMVVGDNPDDLMSLYDINNKWDKYIKFYYKDADKLKANAVNFFNQLLKSNINLSQFQIDIIKNQIEEIKGQSSYDYFIQLIEDNSLELDNNGDAWSNENPNGKWSSYNIGSLYVQPFILLDGTFSVRAYKKDIDWSKIHMSNKELYETTWDLMHNLREPTNDKEKLIIKNMSEHSEYLKQFKNKDEYVSLNCAYWTYAFVDKNGWCDVDDVVSSIDWIKRFMEDKIASIPDDKLLSLFEYKK